MKRLKTITRHIHAALTLATSLLCLTASSAAQTKLPVLWQYTPLQSVNSIAYSPDGSLLAMSGGGGVQIYTASDATLIRCIPTAATGSCNIAFSPDGVTLAVGGASIDASEKYHGVLELWNVASGTPVASLTTSVTTQIDSVAFSPNGLTLADGGAGTSKAVIELWDLKSLTQTRQLNTAATSATHSLAFSPDGQSLLAGGTDSNNTGRGVVERWNVETGVKTNSFPTTAAYVASIAVSPDGSILAVGGTGFSQGPGIVELWSLATGKLIKSLDTAANQSIAALAFSPDGTLLGDCGSATNQQPEIYQSAAGIFELWKVATGTLVATGPGAFNTGGALAFSPDGKTYASGGTVLETGIHYDTIYTNVQINSVSTGQIAYLIKPAIYNFSNSIAISPDGAKLASAGIYSPSDIADASPVVSLWSLTGGNSPLILYSASANASLMIFSPDGTTVAGGGYGEIELWSTANGQLQTFTTPNISSILTLAYAPDGKSIAAGGVNDASTANQLMGALSIVNSSSGDQIASFNTDASNGVQCVAISPDGKTLADGGSAAEDKISQGILEVWNSATGQRLALLSTAASSGVGSIAFSPDGKFLAAGGNIYDAATNTATGVLEIWNPTTGKLVATLPIGLATAVSSLAYTADGGVLLAATNAGIEAFSTTTYQLLATYLGGNRLSLSANGNLLAYFVGESLTVSRNPYFQIPVKTLSLDKTSVQNGEPVTATVTLTSAPPSGGCLLFVSSDNAGAIVPQTISFPAGVTSTTFTINTSGVNTQTTAHITAGFGSKSQTVTLKISPESLSSLTLNPKTVTGGTIATATITLSRPAATGGRSVFLAVSNSSDTTVPASILVPEGQLSAVFPIFTKAVSSLTSSTISASLGGKTIAAPLTLIPGNLTKLSIDPSTVIGGNTSTATLTLSSPAGPGGIQITIRSNSPAAVVPTSVTVPEGLTSITFTVKSTTVTTQRAATITATLNRVTKGVILKVNPKR